MEKTIEDTRRGSTMRYRINWTESVGYCAYVQADSKEEALTKFHEGGYDASLDGFCEMHDDAEAEEDPDKECDGCNGTGTTGGGPPGSALLVENDKPAE